MINLKYSLHLTIYELNLFAIIYNIVSLYPPVDNIGMCKSFN